MAERWILQFCHSHYGPFLDVARQYSALFAGSEFKVLTVYLTGEASNEAREGSASDGVIFLNYSSRQVRGLKIGAIAALKTIAASRDIALIIAHRFKPIYIACLATKLPVIGVHHAFGDYDRWQRRWFASLFQKRLALFGVSNSVRDEIRTKLRTWPADRIETMYNHIDIEAVQSLQVPRDTAREKLGLPKSAWIIGNVGRLHSDKDQSTLINGFALALPRLPHGSKLAIMGSGPLEVQLKESVAQLGVTEEVVFLGQIPNGRHYFKAFDIFALTSNHEPFGMVLLEAMAAGIPSICTECGGGQEVVREAGRLFQLGNAADLAEALIEHSKKSPENLVSLRIRARKILEAKFSDQAARSVFWSSPLLLSHINR